MSKNKAPKLPQQVINLLRKIAQTLPNVFYTVQESQEWTGKDLLLTGLQKQTNGNEIDPEKTYWIDSPVHISSNHFRRMKKAYLSGGTDAVNAYVAKVNDLVIKSQSNN